MEFLSLVYVLLCIAGLILLGLLVCAPMKLYAIAKELGRQTEEMRRQTELLAVLANVQSRASEESPAPAARAKLGTGMRFFWGSVR